MRFLRATALFLLWSIALLQASVHAADIDQIVEGTKKLYDDCDDLRMSFRERVTSDFFSRIDSTRGEILIKKPDKFIFREGRQEIVYDGETLWAFNKIDSQVIRSEAYFGRPFSPGEFLRRLDSGYRLLGSDTLRECDCHMIAIDSLPDMALSDIVVYVDKVNYWVRKLSYRDNVDNLVEFFFDSVEFNVRLKEEEFEFTVPPGVEIVDW